MNDLTTAEQTFDTSADTVIIVAHFENIPGGKTLDVSRLPNTTKYIVAGHPVILETATKKAKALGISGTTFEAVPAGHEVIGATRATVPYEKPFASVMVRGTINEEAFKNATGLTYTQAVKDAFDPLIRLMTE